jgi:hypothetical protein
MAITATRFGNQAAHIVGALRMTFTDVAFDSVYPTGGESTTPADLGLAEVYAAIVTPKTLGTDSVNVTNFYYDVGNKKIVAYDETAAQIADNSDLSNTVVRVVAFGR